MEKGSSVKDLLEEHPLITNIVVTSVLMTVATMAAAAFFLVPSDWINADSCPANASLETVTSLAGEMDNETAGSVRRWLSSSK